MSRVSRAGSTSVKVWVKWDHRKQWRGRVTRNILVTRSGDIGTLNLAPGSSTELVQVSRPLPSTATALWDSPSPLGQTNSAGRAAERLRGWLDQGHWALC